MQWISHREFFSWLMAWFTTVLKTLLRSCTQRRWLFLLSQCYKKQSNRFYNTPDLVYVLLGILDSLECLYVYVYVTWSDKTGLLPISEMAVLKVQCVVSCQWLKLHLPNSHTFYTNSWVGGGGRQDGGLKF